MKPCSRREAGLVIRVREVVGGGMCPGPQGLDLGAEEKQAHAVALGPNVLWGDVRTPGREAQRGDLLPRQ